MTRSRVTHRLKSFLRPAPRYRGGNSTTSSQRSASPSSTHKKQVPKDWKVADENSEDDAFKELMDLVSKRYKGARIIYKTEKPICIEMEHHSRHILVEGKEHQDLKRVLQKMVDEVNFKQARTTDKRFTALYNKLHCNSEEERNDREAKVFYKVGTDKKIELKVVHKTLSWSVKGKHDYLNEAVEAMTKHLDYSEARLGNPEWMEGEAWTEIFNQILPYYYPKAKIFYKIRKRPNSRREIWTLKLALPRDVKMNEEEGHDLMAISKKFSNWLNEHKEDYAEKLTLDRGLALGGNVGEWSPITDRDLHGGVFRPLLDVNTDLEHRANFFYRRDPAGWTVQCRKGKTVLTESHHSLKFAVDQLVHELKFIKVDIRKEEYAKEYALLWKEFDRINKEYPKPSRKNIENAIVYYKTDKSRTHAQKTIHVIKVAHSFWGFSKHSGIKEKAIRKMAEHLSFMPVNNATFESLFGRKYDDKGEEWTNLIKATLHYKDCKLFYKKPDDSNHILKFDDPLKGELFCSKGKADEISAVTDLHMQIKSSKSSAGDVYILSRSILDGIKYHIEEKEVKDDTEGGVFQKLLQAVHKYYEDEESPPKVFYSRDDNGFKVSIKFTQENSSDVAIIVEEISHSLADAIREVKYNFKYIEVKNDNEDFANIFKMLEDKTRQLKTNGQPTYKVLMKEDRTNYYHDNDYWLVKVVDPEFGFQVHGKPQEAAIRKMEKHLEWTKITNEKKPNDNPIWNQVLTVMMHSYGKCELFYKETKHKTDSGENSTWYKVKVAHPNWGPQLKVEKKTLDAAGQKLLQHVAQEQQDGFQNFVFDDRAGHGHHSEQLEKKLADLRWKEANTKVEKGVFKPLFDVLKETFGEKEAAKAKIYYMEAFQQIAIQVQYRHYFFRTENSAINFKVLVKRTTPALKFKEAPRDGNKLYQVPYKELYECINKHAKLHTPSLKAKKARIYCRTFEVKETLEVTLTVEENKTWGKQKKTKHTSIRKGHVVKVDHPIFGFAKYGKTPDDARERLLEHYCYKGEVTKANFKNLNDFEREDNWEKIFKIKESSYGGCRIYYKVNTASTTTTIKVDHERKGLQYMVTKATPDEAAELLYRILSADAEARKKDFPFENYQLFRGQTEGPPDVTLDVWTWKKAT